MRPKPLILLASAGSAALLLGALAFQYIGDMPPCKLCYWQRYPHVAAALAGPVALVVATPLIIAFGALAALTTAGIGIFHTGVERGWWEGPASCSSTGIDGLSTDQLMDQIMTAPLVRCDEIAWQLAGVSMAGWNAILSLGLVVLWLAAWRAARRD
ncbi:disulfide bond formation protein B [Roseivivax jejudonensis]|uniref:Disulfide bond formation protein B n=1 Tax=Roseivivax jejudonensis TaxID=1529041 RepID=A0A1X6YSS8_9RHOB|nr:disulfide bond formation protein B [Roseivivax jejudonensis]SLN28335.1 disulfide bond formation protein B [Roseivivax jejudonensis]